MGAYCVLCGNRNKTVSYHRFPKERHSREKWLSFCGIREENLTTATFLCSNHFKEEDFRKKMNCVIVNPGAIPTITAQKRKKKSNTTDDKCQLSMKKHNLGEIVSVVEADTQTAANPVSTLIRVNCQTPPRIVPEPQYVGDIQTPHLGFVPVTCPNMLLFTPMYFNTLIPVIPVTPTY